MRERERERERDLSNNRLLGILGVPWCLDLGDDSLRPFLIDVLVGRGI